MLKVKARSGESIQQMMSHFKKLTKKEGLIRDMKRVAYYEKPSERGRRRVRKARRAAEFRAGEFVALGSVEGRVRLASLSYDGEYQFRDGFNNIHNIVYVWSTEVRALEDAVAELEELVNSGSAREQDFHGFFERHPQLIISDEYKAAHSKIVLDRDRREAMIPDFVLEPLEQGALCDLLEVKRPDARMFVLKKNRMRFSAAVMEACAQVREYSAYFDDKRHRQRIETKYGLLIYRPRMFVIIGRKGSVSPIDVRRMEEDIPKLRIKTYDALILEEYERVRRMRRGSI